jgi:hypothetical protein
VTRRILKWTIPVDDQRHLIGAGPVVHVDSQSDPTFHDPGAVQVWTDENDSEHVAPTSARVYATGQPIPEDGEVLGTALVLGGALVWHVVRHRPAGPHQHDCSLHSCWRPGCCNPRRPDCTPETT